MGPYVGFGWQYANVYKCSSRILQFVKAMWISNAISGFNWKIKKSNQYKNQSCADDQVQL